MRKKFLSGISMQTIRDFLRDVLLVLGVCAIVIFPFVLLWFIAEIQFLLTH